MQLLKSIAALALSTLVFADEPGGSLVVHEWGTFTSVAGEDGNPVRWAPLNGPEDLPSFVYRLHGQEFKASTPGFVRMETPVLYFYAPYAMTLSVHVNFPQGLITEWYPHATSVKPDVPSLNNVRNGRAEWDSIEITPGIDPAFPKEKAASHYYAARDTDSASIRSGDDREKLIFYRGIANFPVPLHPQFAGDGRIYLRNTGLNSIPFAILFENHGGKVGYRFLRGLTDSFSVEMPVLDASVDTLRTELEAALVGLGLFPKEAHAMVETWRDSWFEEGMRVFYAVPRAMTDSVLTLSVAPSPSQTERVFVGRVEVLAPWMEQEIQTVLNTHNCCATVAKYGRFLSPFIEQMQRRPRI
jgi:hypothetical protein